MGPSLNISISLWVTGYLYWVLASGCMIVLVKKGSRYKVQGTRIDSKSAHLVIILLPSELG